MMNTYVCHSPLLLHLNVTNMMNRELREGYTGKRSTLGLSQVEPFGVRATLPSFDKVAKKNSYI